MQRVTEVAISKDGPRVRQKTVSKLGALNQSIDGLRGAFPDSRAGGEEAGTSRFTVSRHNIRTFFNDTELVSG